MWRRYLVRCVQICYVPVVKIFRMCTYELISKVNFFLYIMVIHNWRLYFLLFYMYMIIRYTVRPFILKNKYTPFVVLEISNCGGSLLTPTTSFLRFLSGSAIQILSALASFLALALSISCLRFLGAVEFSQTFLLFL